MSKLYIFAIGGTGTRVLKSLTMLLASGMNTNVEEIVPMVIDTDINNGDLERFRRVINDYHKINSKLYSGVSHNEFKDNFFRTKIAKPKELNISGLDFGTLADMFDYSGLNASGHKETKFLIDLLLSEDNLIMKLENGFLGNPNVGSIVLKHVVETREFKDFTQDFQQGDRIFIINSIFGGTGAAGFPLLLKIFRDNTSGLNNIGLINSSIIGGVTVLPYFEVDVEKFQNGESAINSDTFITKSKAALSYYDRHVGHLINALYYIGDTKKSSYENIEGGTEQKNPANFIELASAMAILNFINYEPGAKTTDDLDKFSRYFEFAIDKNEGQFNLNQLKEDNDSFSKSLILFTYLSIYITNFFEGAILNKNLAWKNELNIPSTFYKSDFSKAAISFFENFYYKWLIEMSFSKHGRKFTPFNLYTAQAIEDYHLDNPVKFSITLEKLFTIVNERPAKRMDKFLHKDSIKFDQIFTELVQETKTKNLALTELAVMDVLKNGLEKIYNERYKY